MAGWVETELGEVCHVYQPQTLAQKQLRPGPFPVYGANGQIGWHDEFNHEGGQLLIGCRGSVGFVHITTDRAWINGNAMVVVPKDGVIERDFLAYALRGGVDLSSSITGAAQPQITRTSLTPIPIAFPADLREQRRIVAILDEAFEGIATAKANAERNLQNARELFGSRMQLLLGQEAAWERVQLEELLARGWITSHLDGNHGSDYPRKEEFVDAGVPYIAAGAIQGGTVDFDEAKYLAPQRAASIRKGLAKDRDVLFAHNATVGPVAILSTDEDVVILGTSLTYYRCDPQHIHPEYLAHFMLSPAFTSQYAQVMRQSTRNQVPITKQRELFHVIPPIDVQRRIADDLDELSMQTERLADIERRKLIALDELKKSLLHQAFTGELRSVQ
jgi:type I restriction enzyme, S subunit